MPWKKEEIINIQTYEPLAYMYNPNAIIRPKKETVYKHISFYMCIAVMGTKRFMLNFYFTVFHIKCEIIPFCYVLWEK